MSRAPPTALVARLPSGSHVIDLRHAPRASVVELDVFAAVAEQLEASGPARGLRVWVLGDATVDWLADPAQCWAAIFNLLEASRPGPDDSDLTLIAVLAGAARKEAAFPSLLRAAGLQVFAARPAGGLPLQEVMIGGQSSTSPIGPPMPGEAPRSARAAAHGRGDLEPAGRGRQRPLRRRGHRLDRRPLGQRAGLSTAASLSHAGALSVQAAAGYLRPRCWAGRRSLRASRPPATVRRRTRGPDEGRHSTGAFPG